MQDWTALNIIYTWATKSFKILSDRNWLSHLVLWTALNIIEIVGKKSRSKDLLPLMLVRAVSWQRRKKHARGGGFESALYQWLFYCEICGMASLCNKTYWDLNRIWDSHYLGSLVSLLLQFRGLHPRSRLTAVSPS